MILCCRSPSVISNKSLSRIQKVSRTSGLIAFWDFSYEKNKIWTSYRDSNASEKSYPIFLRRIGDSLNYSESTWPYTDSNSISYDYSGPFGQAIRFDRGFVYGSIPRILFDGTNLDLRGNNSFTLIAWVKFVGERHMVAGIWDEGGWNKYSGRRQVALFSGLFRQKGVIAHVSATGTASYPQSSIPGSQYARRRAIDGQPFRTNQWVAMAMTYDPVQSEVKAWLNGRSTFQELPDPVEQNVFGGFKEIHANPYYFESPIYSPKRFILKYNGYNLKEDVREHRIEVDLEKKQLTYYKEGKGLVDPEKHYQIKFDLKRSNKSLLTQTILFDAISGRSIALPKETEIQIGDVVVTSLELWEGKSWKQVGTILEHTIAEGAPFTFGRALGLASDELEHGSELFLDGVAVFNRVLSSKELLGISFVKEN